MKDETYDLVEQAAQAQLKRSCKMEQGTKEFGNAMERSIRLIELLATIDKDSTDYHDKEEKRRIEEDRLKASIELEQIKQRVTAGRATLEIAKVVVPVVLTMIGYNVFQKRLLIFEETGRLTTTASKDLHLPRFTK